MQEVSVIIPNFNGMAYLDGVLAGLECQTVSNFDVILVDNGSNDGSCAFVAARYPWVHLIELPENFGFCKTESFFPCSLILTAPPDNFLLFFLFFLK